MALKHERARQWLRRAYVLAHRPDEKTAMLAAWASALGSLRRFREGVALLERSVRLDPSRETNKISYVTLLATLVDLGQLARAHAEAEKLLMLHPRDRYVLNACGRLYRALHTKTGEPRMAEKASRCFAARRHT